MNLRLNLRVNQRFLKFPLAAGQYVVGSAPSCAIHVPHPTVSSRHARIVVERGAVTLEDLGSRNGTLINLRRVRGPALLAHGDEIVLGAVAGFVEVVDAAELEARVRMVPPSATDGNDPPPAPEPRPPTASASDLEAFTLDHLPVLLSLLEQGAQPTAMAQEVGSRLFTAFPLARLEIVRRATAGEALLFSAASAVDPPGPLPVFDCAHGELAMRATFYPPSLLEAYGPVIPIGLALVALARSGAERAAKVRPPAGPPPLPTPPSVDPYLQEVYQQAARVARGEISVLIQGESGTGKELLARYMHAASGRPQEKFVALNCAALPRDLLELELFGIERAVATGVDARPGKFELADRGTLFLDEIGDMGLETQAKILRVLQEGEVYRLGSDRPRQAKVRVLAATNRDVEMMVRSDRFRSDLYHRIAAWVVELPPLRRRTGDVPNLAAHFLALEAELRGVKIAGISRAAVEELLAHEWPGNVRELRSVMARAALFLEDGDLVESRHLWRTLRREMERPARTLKERLAELERNQIQLALQSCLGDAEKAAARLGVSRATIYRRMKALGIQDPVARSGP